MAATTINQRIADQRRWIKAHGGDLAGYVERYGSGDDITCYGSGGEEIYAADVAYLAALHKVLGPRRVRLSRYA